MGGLIEESSKEMSLSPTPCRSDRRMREART